MFPATAAAACNAKAKGAGAAPVLHGGLRAKTPGEEGKKSWKARRLRP
jgi:hypothetical protein